MSNDPRYQTLGWLSDFWTPENILTVGEATAAGYFCFAGDDIELDRIFFDKAIDYIVTYHKPSVRTLKQHDQKIYGYEETVPIGIQCINKEGIINAELLMWQIEKELRRVCENYPFGSFRDLTTASESTVRLGEVTLYSVTYLLRYVRLGATSVSAPTLTYGDGHLEDFVDIWDWSKEGNASADGAANGTTLIDSARTEADDYWNGYYIKMLSGTCAGEIRLITDFDDASNTFTVEAFTDQIDEDDEYVIGVFTETRSNMAASDLTPSLDPEDVLVLQGVFDDAGTEETGYLEFTLPVALDPDIYTKCLVRHKSGDSNQECRVVIVYSNASTSLAVDDDNDEEWTVTTVTPETDSAKTITGYRVYVTNPASGATGTYKAYYDYVKFCKGVFTLPHVSADGKGGGVFPKFTSGDVLLKVPGRGGEITNDLGMSLPEIVIRGDMLQGESWGTPFGQYFLEILRNDKWSWFTSDQLCCKVRIVNFEPSQDVASGAVRTFTLTLRMFSYSDLYDDVWNGVDGWLGIES